MSEFSRGFGVLGVEGGGGLRLVIVDWARFSFQSDRQGMNPTAKRQHPINRVGPIDGALYFSKEI